jgi:hypothetical protein
MARSQIPLSSRRLAALMAARKMSIPDLAAAIHVDAATVSEFLRNGFGPGAAAILGIAFPGVDTLWIAGSVHDRSRCPLPDYTDEAMEEFAAGGPPRCAEALSAVPGADVIEHPSAGEAKGRKKAPLGFLRVEVLRGTQGAERDGRFPYLDGAVEILDLEGLRGVRMNGESMVPYARHGDVVLFGTREASSGDLAVVVWREEYTISAAFRRYIETEGGGVRLDAESRDVDAVSLRPLYPPIILRKQQVAHAWKYMGTIVAP